MSMGLADHLDLELARERLARTGRAQVEGVLGDGTPAIYDALLDRDMIWMRAIRNPFNADVPVAVFEAEPPQEQARLIGMAHQEATEGYQFVFDRLRLGPARLQGLPIPQGLYDLHAVFNSEPWLDFARRITGDDRINQVDAQATRHLPGHFLNAQTDESTDAGSLYGYVLNVSPRWRAEWGGLLMFLAQCPQPMAAKPSRVRKAR